VLAAAWLNRDRLSAEQTTTVRYIAGMTLYVSSTADIFINGVSVAPWLPFVLAVLSIAGILAGMAMRVRAFLYLGASFLVLALLAMIWHAAVNLQQTWVWYVSGIVLGALIIAIFAVFEKKRADILRLVDGLKQWEK
jgi:fructose-specific phosphotransferase system IIC component